MREGFLNFVPIEVQQFDLPLALLGTTLRLALASHEEVKVAV